MRKLAIAALLAAALSVTALSNQKAAAWGCGNCGCGDCNGCFSYGGCWGFGLSFNFTRCGCSTPCLKPCGFCAPCSCPGVNICDSGLSGLGYGGCASGACGYSMGGYGYPVAPAATGIQTVGYGDAAGYGYAIPSYWYGR